MDDLDALILAFEREAAEIAPAVRQVVSKGSLHIKQDWARRWSGHPTIRQLPAAIGYDLTTDPTGTSSRIGVDKSTPQGPLAHLIEFGSVNNGPIPGGQPALDAEEPRFVRALEDLGGRRIEG